MSTELTSFSLSLAGEPANTSSNSTKKKNSVLLFTSFALSYGFLILDLVACRRKIRCSLKTISFRSALSQTRSNLVVYVFGFFLCMSVYIELLVADIVRNVRIKTCISQWHDQTKHSFAIWYARIGTVSALHWLIVSVILFSVSCPVANALSISHSFSASVSILPSNRSCKFWTCLQTEEVWKS